MPLSRYPKVTQDISLRVPFQTNYFNVYMTLVWGLGELRPNASDVSVEPLDIYRQQDSDRKTYTFRITIVSRERTLTNTEVNTMLDKLAQKARDELGAERL
jgi:phenylalanyl-tRNA synthetase beta subunit